MTREIEYTYIYICPGCGIERFSTETPQEYFISIQTKEDVCMNCDNKGMFNYIGSVGKKKKRYPIFRLKMIFWNHIVKIKERHSGDRKNQTDKG